MTRNVAVADFGLLSAIFPKCPPHTINLLQLKPWMVFITLLDANCGFEGFEITSKYSSPWSRALFGSIFPKFSYIMPHIARVCTLKLVQLDTVIWSLHLSKSWFLCKYFGRSIIFFQLMDNFQTCVINHNLLIDQKVYLAYFYTEKFDWLKNRWLIIKLCKNVFIVASPTPFSAGGTNFSKTASWGELLFLLSMGVRLHFGRSIYQGDQWFILNIFVFVILRSSGKE